MKYLRTHKSTIITRKISEKFVLEYFCKSGGLIPSKMIRKLHELNVQSLKKMQFRTCRIVPRKIHVSVHIKFYFNFYVERFLIRGCSSTL